MSHRVAITGIGVISCLGLSHAAASDSLRRGRSGIARVPEWETLGLRSTIAGQVPDLGGRLEASRLPSRLLPTMPQSALYGALAAEEALDDAGLASDDLRQAGCIVGSGISDTRAIYEGGAFVYSGRARRVSPYSVLHSMSSSTSAALVAAFGFGGRSYSITSACATATHCIGAGFELVRSGALPLVITGGCESADPLVAAAFSALRTALSTAFLESPERASRPFDARRDGFVLASGAAILVLEERQRALARGARIRGEVLGFGANSDSYDLTRPDPEGGAAADCMRMALRDAGLAPADVSYINCHATSTVAGDIAEARAIRRVFGSSPPALSSTKSMCGHALGASGALEAGHSLAMLEGGFLAPSINVEEPDPELADLPIVTRTTERAPSTILSNSFGFGGANGCLVLGSR